MLFKVWMWTLLRNTTCHFCELCYNPCTCYQLGTNLFKSFSSRGRPWTASKYSISSEEIPSFPPILLHNLHALCKFGTSCCFPEQSFTKKMGAHVLNSNECTPTLNFQNRQNIPNEWMINQKEERCIWNMHEPN